MTFPTSGPDEARAAAEPPTVSPEGTEHPRSPLLAALGAGETAFNAVAHAFAEAFTTAATTQKTVQQRVAELPAELDELRVRFSGDELRKAMEAYRAQVERAYSVFAERGEETWGRLREQPQVRQAITTLESYGGRLDGRADAFARAGQRFTGRAADAVVDATAATADAVEETGTAAAGAIEDVGEETAAVTRKTTRKAAPRRAPRPSGPSSD